LVGFCDPCTKRPTDDVDLFSDVVTLVFRVREYLLEDADRLVFEFVEECGFEKGFEGI